MARSTGRSVIVVAVIVASASYLLLGVAFFRVLTTFAGAFVVLTAISMILVTVRSWRLLGPVWLPLFRYVLGLLPASATLGSEGVYFAFRGVLLTVLWAIGRETHFDYTLWLMVIIGCDTTFTFFLRMQPPAVLVLTNSTSVASDFLNEIHHAAGLYRAVGLLRVDQMSPDAQKYAMLSSLRVSASRDWRDVVEVLSRLVPIIIVDTREVSGGLRYEANRVLQPDRIYKTVFVIGVSRKSPVLHDSIATTPSPVQDRCDTMAEECLPLLTWMLKERAALPTPDRGTVAILGAYRKVAQRFIEL